MRSRCSIIFCLFGKLGWALILFKTVTVSAADIDIFRLVDFHGFLETRQRYDSYRTQSTNLESVIREPKAKREAGVTTQSYIYHPNFVKMNISGSFVMDSRSYTLEQTSSFAQTEIESDSIDFTWNFGSSISILEKKPYPLQLFYNRQNPVAGGGLSETFNVKNTDYGFNLSFLKPFSPVNIYIRGSRRTREGESTLQLFDDKDEILSIAAIHKFKNNLNVNFDYDLSNSESITGSPNLPIQERIYTNQRFLLRHDWLFGKKSQFLFSSFNGLSILNNPERLDLNISPRFRWRHSSRLVSNYKYDFSSSEFPDDSVIKNHSGDASLVYNLSDRLKGDVKVNVDHSEEGLDVSRSSYGFSTFASYIRPVSIVDGQLSLGGGFNYSRTDIEATENQVEVIDESHTLIGTTRITLEREFVTDFSVVVTNAGRTQTFIENLDYQLIVIGSKTLLERLVGGNILDGQAVLVSYAFDPGGTSIFSTLGTSFSADLSLARYYRLYLRHTYSNQTQEEGELNNQLNSVNFIELGASANAPLPWWGMSAGVDAIFRYREADISSSDSTDFGVQLQLPLPYRSSFSVNANRSQVNNHDSPEDLSITRFTASLNSRPWHRLFLTATASHDINTGGVLESRRTDARLNVSWPIRKLRIGAEVFYTLQTQGSLERDNLSASLVIRRNLW